MTFNQVIWDALVFAATNAHSMNRPEMIRALEEYAAACDGKVQLAFGWQRVRSAVFIPNPIPRY